MIFFLGKESREIKMEMAKQMTYEVGEILNSDMILIARLRFKNLYDPCLE